MSMAYTANSRLDFKKIPTGLDLPIDKYIKINASRDDIALSDDTTKQRFFATPMNFKTMLANNDKVEEIRDATIQENRLKCLCTLKGSNGINSIPRLSYGTWEGGEGWYYVCPCSFWKYNKDKAESLFYIEKGLTTEDTSMDSNLRMALKNQLSEEDKTQLKRILNKVKSPCGVECAVCHDTGAAFSGNRHSGTESIPMVDFIMVFSHGLWDSETGRKVAGSKYSAKKGILYGDGVLSWKICRGQDAH